MTLQLLSHDRLRSAALVIQPVDAVLADLGPSGSTPGPIGTLEMRVVRWRRNDRLVRLPQAGVRLLPRRNRSGDYLVFDCAEGQDGVVRSPYFGFDRPDEAHAVDLLITGEVYRPTRLVGQPVPSSDRATLAELAPNIGYPFGRRRLGPGRPWPTLIYGRTLAERPEGRPLPGIQVTADAVPTALAGESDAAGRFVLVMPRRWRGEAPVLTFRLGDRVLASQPVEIVAGETVRLPDLTLAAT